MKVVYILALYVWMSISNAAGLSLQSPAFKLNTMIPEIYSCKGTDTSPPLSWKGIPANTKSLVLVMDDPDAQAGVWTHWVVFNIPPATKQLVAGAVLPQGAASANNSWRSTGYRGPCPPLGVHRYVFKLYAVNLLLPLQEGADSKAVLDAITGHVLAHAELVGLFQH